MNSSIYILRSNQGQIVKIGETATDVNLRHKDYTKTYLLEGFSIHKIYTVRNEKRKLIEKKIHEKLKSCRISGISRAKELFECSIERAEKIIEETIKEFQPSLFIDLFEAGKLDFPQAFFETNIILEFLKEDNVSVYNFCNKFKVLSNPDKSPLFNQDGLPDQDLLIFNDKFPFEDIVIHHKSSPYINDIIELYLDKETYEDESHFLSNLKEKIYVKINEYESKIKKIERQSDREKLINETTENIKSLTIPMHVILTISTKVNLQTLKKSQFAEKFIKCFFAEFSKLNSNERTLIMTKKYILVYFLSFMCLDNTWDKKLSEMIKEEIAKNGLKDFIKTLLPLTQD